MRSLYMVCRNDLYSLAAFVCQAGVCKSLSIDTSIDASIVLNENDEASKVSHVSTCTDYHLLMFTFTP